MAEHFTHYTYFRSSAAFRTRIALNLKGIAAEQRAVHLMREGGAQFDEAYTRLNPQHLVPTLVHDGHAIGQSLAIIEYLDEIHPEPRLLPRDALGRARVRQLAYAVACDIHPINNLRVQKYLRKALGHSQDDADGWARHWIELGFAVLETMLAGSAETGEFCHGDAPTMADICLVPQMANARRVETDLDPFPTLLRIEASCFALASFADALPAKQPDAE